VARQSRSAGEGAGRRFKRRRRRRGKRGAKRQVVSERRGLDKAAEGKESQKRDRSERPGDRKFERSRKRRPMRRKRRRQGGDRGFRDRPQTGRPLDREPRGPQRQGLEDMRARINEIKSRRESFAADRPEQIAERRGFDPQRLQAQGLGSPDRQGVEDYMAGDQNQIRPGYSPPQIPTSRAEAQAQFGISQDGMVQPAPDPTAWQQAHSGVGTDGQIEYPPQPMPGVGSGGFDPGYTPVDHPGPTAPPGVPTDAYGKPAPGPSGPYNPGPMPAPAPYTPPAQMNPRAAGMQRFAQRPQPAPQPGVVDRKPEEEIRY
jgi:hypothetical protein